jgi:hypothetical protein
MKRRQEAAGYRSHALPDLLPELEHGGGKMPSIDCRLIAADRKTLIWAQHLDKETSAVIKMYRHRGAISWQREKCFRFRVQREFDALSFLDAHGVPCTKPIFWSYGYSPCFGRYEILATHEIENVVQLDTFTRTSRPTITEPCLFAAYGLVRRMHKSGCHHGAMFPRNILITRWDSAAPDAYIIDMPQAIFFRYDITGTRMAWIDLYALTFRVMEHTGADGCMALLRHYGLEDEAARQLVNHVKMYPSSKLKKTLFRAECEGWELLAHIGIVSVGVGARFGCLRHRSKRMTLTS